MKKALILLLTLCLCLTLFGCGKSGDGNGGRDGKSAEKVTEKAAEPADDADEKVRDYIEQNRSEFDEINKQYEGSMDFSMEAEDGNLIVIVKYLIDIPVDGASIERSINNSGDTYVNVYKSLRTRTGLADAKLILRYYDHSGNLVLEKVIDDSFTPGEDEETGDLESFVNSASFQESIAAGGTDDLDISAHVEDGSVVVVLYSLKQTVDRSRLAEVQANWDATFSDGEMDTSFRSVYTLIDQTYHVDGLIIRIRITDPTDEILYEKDYTHGN